MVREGIKALVALALFIGVVAVVPGDMAFAQAGQVKEGIDAIGGEGSPSVDSVLEKAVNAFLLLIGAVAIVMIVYGGFRYVTSAGEASAVSAAKNTILYAVIGLVVALLAYSISDYVLDVFEGGSTNTTEEDTTGVRPDSISKRIFL